MINYNDYFKPIILQVYGVVAGVAGWIAAADEVAGLILTITGVVSLIYASRMYNQRRLYFKEKRERGDD